MADSFAGDQAITKANAAADAINKLLMNIVLRCTQNVGEGPRNYFDVGVIGYGANAGVGPCFGGALQGRSLVSIQELADNPRVEERTKKTSDGAGGLTTSIVKFPVWFDPVAQNGTPMADAVQMAAHTLTSWVNAHNESYPPIVINITDGEPNTDPMAAAKALSRLETADGNVLMYNLHLSSLASHPILFPASSSALPDSFARMLFEMSSELPRKIQDELEVEGYTVGDGARGFIFNADAVALIQFLDIGTRLALEGSAGDR
jgi:hypothetical protein